MLLHFVRLTFDFVTGPWFRAAIRWGPSSPRIRVALRTGSMLLFLLITATAYGGDPKVGEFVERHGDEIVVCGQLIHTTAPVVLWMDPGGYDAYRVERRFAPFADSSWEKSRPPATPLDSPNRYGLRKDTLTPDEIERVRGGGWELPSLQQIVDQFVIHYDVCGTSERCFQFLHDMRGLSVHFLLDIDGTIYQTLDLKERAWHATTSNSRSVGVEIAHIGAYPPEKRATLEKWYARDTDGRWRLTLPAHVSQDRVRTPNFVGRPARNELIVGTIQGQELAQYDFTPEQYDSLIKLTAALCKIFPLLKCDYPRDSEGRLIPHKLADDRLKAYQGLIGHYHIQTNKTDPGPAFQWELVTGGARELLESD